jgi:hypothetical protein
MRADGLTLGLEDYQRGSGRTDRAGIRVVDLGAYERSLFRNTAPSRVYPIRSS